MKKPRAQLPAKQSTTKNGSPDVETYTLLARRPFERFEANHIWIDYEIEDWFRVESELLNPLPPHVAEIDEILTVRVPVSTSAHK